MGPHYVGHNYIGPNYTGHNYTGHNYFGHKYQGHNRIGHNLISGLILIFDHAIYHKVYRCRASFNFQTAPALRPRPRAIKQNQPPEKLTQVHAVGYAMQNVLPCVVANAAGHPLAPLIWEF